MGGPEPSLHRESTDSLILAVLSSVSLYYCRTITVRLSVPVAKGEAPTLSRDEDSSSSPPPSPPAPLVPPARNKTCTVV